MLALAAAVAGAWGRSLWRSRGAAAGAAAVIAVAGVVLWSTNVIPSPTPFSVQQWFPVEATARGTYAKINNLVDRILPDPEARGFFEAHGLPQAERIARAESRYAIIYDPELAPARRWLVSEGQGVYLRWLLARPLERLADQVEQAWILLGAEQQQLYMPDGWVGRERSRAVRWSLGVTSSKTVLLALLALAPIALWRARRHAGGRLALCLIASGWLGSAAAFYADTSEPGRHCYGSGQQIAFGLFLAGLAWLDHALGARRRGEPSRR
jgi:hypothetical protein